VWSHEKSFDRLEELRDVAMISSIECCTKDLQRSQDAAKSPAHEQPKCLAASEKLSSSTRINSD